jgi:hypothetical protein
VAPPCIWPIRWAGRACFRQPGLTEKRAECIREREALNPRRSPRTLLAARCRPGVRKDPGLFVSGFTRPAPRRGPRSMDRTTGDGGRSLTSCRKATAVLADGSPCNFADVAQLAEHGHAMAEATSSKLVIRSTSGVSMHSAAASHGVDGPGCARPWPSHVQRDTHVRRDARVWAQPKWTQPQTRRVRLDGRGHRAFNPGTLGSLNARSALDVPQARAVGRARSASNPARYART